MLYVYAYFYENVPPLTTTILRTKWLKTFDFKRNVFLTEPTEPTRGLGLQTHSRDRWHNRYVLLHFVSQNLKPFTPTTLLQCRRFRVLTWLYCVVMCVMSVLLTMQTEKDEKDCWVPPSARASSGALHVAVLRCVCGVMC